MAQRAQPYASAVFVRSCCLKLVEVIKGTEMCALKVK